MSPSRTGSIVELAEALAATKGTIGYHVKVLMDAGLLRIAHTGTVPGGTEQYFEPTAPSLRIAPTAPGGGAFLVRAALGEMLPAAPDAPGVTGLWHLRLPADRARELAAEPVRFGSTDPCDGDGESYGLLVSLYRADLPRLPEQ